MNANKPKITEATIMKAKPLGDFAKSRKGWT